MFINISYSRWRFLFLSEMSLQLLDGFQFGAGIDLSHRMNCKNVAGL